MGSDPAAAVRRSIDAGRALPAECYRDPEFFSLEVDQVLRPGWHAVARWDDLPKPGDYRSFDFWGEPLLAVRDASERLRVFSRVCQHRAHPVVEGSGNTKRFVCPYHRWSYDLDGALRTAPLMDESPDFDRSSCGLPELRTETWQGFVLTTLDPEAPPLGPELGDLEDRVGPLGLAEMVTLAVLEYDSPWNWKVLVDNFMESYHHLGPHAESLQRSNRARDTFCDGARKGPFSLLENPGHGGAPDFSVAHVFPTLLFAVFEDSEFGSWYEMLIRSHDRFDLRIHVLGTPALAGKPQAVEQLRAVSDAVHREDITVCDGVQRGIQSRLWRPGPLSHHENALTRFYQHLSACLA